MKKTQTLQTAAIRLEQLLDRGDLSGHTRRQIQQAHQEVKQVRSRLEHEGLMARQHDQETRAFVASRNLAAAYGTPTDEDPTRFPYQEA